MEKFKQEIINGKVKHFSVAGIIEHDEKYLMEDRNIPPLGYSFLTGHMDEGETALESLKREVKEETSFVLINPKILFEVETDNIKCPYNSKLHHWIVIKAEVEGIPKRDPKEVKSIGWFTKEEIKNLNLNPIAKFLIEKLEFFS